ncbi:9661_t:CDS:1 [Diversispora eburnea]|uniref:9661_t:CDS:1 n=1 Tax=Diversispora eburnea TaxID=1213867 RepID=A0A9N9G6X0_9GLOM|nr:9661_t:CDS:1 [Diversispora eburnea]
MISVVFIKSRISRLSRINSRINFNKFNQKCFYDTLETNSRRDSFYDNRQLNDIRSPRRNYPSNFDRGPNFNRGSNFERGSNFDRGSNFERRSNFERGRPNNREWNESKDFSRKDNREWNESKDFSKKDNREWNENRNFSKKDFGKKIENLDLEDLKKTDKVDEIGKFKSDFGDYDDKTLPKKIKRKKKEKIEPPPPIEIPGFVRIEGARQNMVVYFEELRRDNPKRRKFRSLMIHGLKHLQEMLRRGFAVRSIGITTNDGINSPDELLGGCKEVYNNKEKYPAERYYVTSVEWTRKILGNDARVDAREVWAELPFPNIQFPEKINKLLVLDHVASPVDMGMLIRSAKALHWDASYSIAGTVDLYDDKVIRTSSCESVDWPWKIGFWQDVYDIARQNNLTLIIADTLPHNIIPTKSPNNICFWDPMTQEVVDMIPSKIALVLGSKMHGVTYRDAREGIIRVSIPMYNNVNSMNVGMAGNILMYELNRLMNSKATNEDKIKLIQ